MDDAPQVSPRSGPNWRDLSEAFTGSLQLHSEFWRFGDASCWMSIEMISGTQHGSSTHLSKMIAGCPGPCTIHLSMRITGYCCRARFRSGLSNSSWKFLDSNRRIWWFLEIGGTPKSSILVGFSLLDQPFWGTPLFGKLHLFFFTMA